MIRLLIEGGIPLKGKVRVPGSKNAALPCIAAAVLITNGELVLENVPEITDVKIMLGIFKDLGGIVREIRANSFSLSGKEIREWRINPDLARRLRASILFVGPLLARFGKVVFPFPGGDLIGKRPIDTHLRAFEDLGAVIKQEGELYTIEGKLLPGKIKCVRLRLGEASVTATENILMAVSNLAGETEISNIAVEPHVQNLIELLEKFGVNIRKIGQRTIVVSGKSYQVTVNKKTIKHKINSDEIVAGSLIVASLATKGGIELEQPPNLGPIGEHLEKMGVALKRFDNILKVEGNIENLKPQDIKVSPWPGLPTDIQPPLTVLATQLKGKTKVTDLMFENRFAYARDLIKMNAKIEISDNHHVNVEGPSELRERKIETPDIRAGFALIIAALVAKGTSEIENIELVDRGYEKIEETLANLGAKIKRIE